jgi:hypothetical protein
MIFIHAHRNSWHQDKNIDLLIKELDLQKKYFNFNNNDIVPLLKNEVESEEEHFYHRLGSRCTYKRSYKLWVEDVWFELFNGEILMPEKIDGKGSAQFLVKKEKVLIYTKDFYIRLLNWLLITEIDEKLKVTKNAQSPSSQVSGRILEYVWNVLYEK